MDSTEATTHPDGLAVHLPTPTQAPAGSLPPPGAGGGLPLAPVADDEDAGGWDIPTRAVAREKRDQEKHGLFRFPLHRTGGFALVRGLSMADKTTLAGLPTHLQAKVLEVFNEQRQAQGDGAITAKRIATNLGRQERLANQLCLAGFVKPRLVMTEADLDPDDPYCLLVSDIHVEERIAYLNIVSAADTEAVQRLTPFLDDAPGGRVGPVPAGAVPPAAV